MEHLIDDVLPEFGPGGTALWDSLYRPGLRQSDIDLVREACRMKDRLDILNNITSGDAETWAHIADGDANMILVLDNAMVEQRQSVNTFRLLLQDIEKRVGGEESADEDPFAGL